MNATLETEDPEGVSQRSSERCRFRELGTGGEDLRGVVQRRTRRRRWKTGCYDSTEEEAEEVEEEEGTGGNPRRS